MDTIKSQMPSSMLRQEHPLGTDEKWSKERETELLGIIARQTEENFELQDVVGKLRSKVAEYETILLKRNHGKAAEEDTEVPLYEWEPTTYRAWLRTTLADGQHALWRTLLKPYVAAVVAGLEEEMERLHFKRRFLVDVPKSAFSNWTRNYFHAEGPVASDFLYARHELVYWWKRFGLHYEEIRDLVAELEKRQLL